MSRAHLLDSGDLHICADGGANRLYDLWGPEQRNRWAIASFKISLCSFFKVPPNDDQG